MAESGTPPSIVGRRACDRSILPFQWWPPERPPFLPPEGQAEPDGAVTHPSDPRPRPASQHLARKDKIAAPRASKEAGRVRPLSTFAAAKSPLS